MRMMYAAATLALTVGCAVKPVQYTEVPAPANPEALIERVLMEHPPRFRNGYATVTPDYVEYGSGSTTMGPVFGTKSVEKVNVTRLYFTSIAESKLYPKADYWRIDSLNKEGKVIGRAYSYDKTIAASYISALEEMRERALNRAEK